MKVEKLTAIHAGLHETGDGRYRIFRGATGPWTIRDTRSGREQHVGSLLEARIVISASRLFDPTYDANK